MQRQAAAGNNIAQVAELVDARVSVTRDRKVVWVRVPPWAPLLADSVFLRVARLPILEMPKNIKSKYTREMLEPVVASSTSIAEVLRKLGLAVTGGSYAWIPKVIASYNLNCDHFTGKTTNSGQRHKGGPEKLGPAEILVLDRLDGRRESLPKLRRAMREYGMAEICAECDLLPVWNGKPLVLQVEHRNGNWLDNRPGNVCFICPNCHTQTETFSGRKNRRVAA